jgi:hypothetical protein
MAIPIIPVCQIVPRIVVFGVGEDRPVKGDELGRRDHATMMRDGWTTVKPPYSANTDP